MENPIQIVSAEEWMSRHQQGRQPFHEKYLAMYSSVADAIVTDPTLMLVPVDDHMVHRGDAVFETLKCVNGSIYNLRAHLDRLWFSADRICIDKRIEEESLVDTVRQTVRAAGAKDCLIRVLLSRGPGSLSVNPYDCPKSQVYIMVYAGKPAFMQQHPEGARVGVSRVPLKPPHLATVKTCNYIPNVLMSREAADRGLHFVVALDDSGNLGESATENVMVLSPGNELLVPSPDYILKGTTIQRVLKLAESLVEEGVLKQIVTASISREQIDQAPEMYIVGTTPNVTAVVEFEGRPVGDGKPGPMFQRLSTLLLDDILHNPEMKTAV